MDALEPVLVADLFPEERSGLLALLSELSDEEWARPTVCAGWSVKDVALHILGVDVGVLSRKRDGHSGSTQRIDDWDELVAFLNEWNALWVDAARRMSPRLLLHFLKMTGGEVQQFFRSLDPFAVGEPVSWAGPEPAPAWLDMAREYTELWLHQQHIRDAVGRLGLTERRFLAPVLATFVRALPHTYRDAAAPAGTHVRLNVSGEAGGTWSLVRQEQRWELARELGGEADATVSIDQETAWRLLTKGISKQDAERNVSYEGDRSLGAIVLDAVSIIA